MEDTAENIKVENTAGSYTYREHIRKLFTPRSREDTAKYYKNGEYNRELLTWRTQQNIIKMYEKA